MHKSDQVKDWKRETSNVQKEEDIMKEKENILMDDRQTTKTYLRCGQQTKYTNVNGDRGKRAVGPD